MKKAMMIVAIVGLAAVAAQAQHDGIVTNATRDTQKQYWSAKSANHNWSVFKQGGLSVGVNAEEQRKLEKKAADSVTKAADQAAFEHAKAQAAAPQAQTKQTAAKTENKEWPSYYYGREGKMMALSEVHQRRNAEKNAEKKQEKKETEAKESKSNFFTRMMGCEKFKGETDEQWQSRLYYMAIK